MSEPRPDSTASRYTGFEAIPIRVTVSVGPIRCRLSELMKLAAGEVIPLEHEIGEPFELRSGDVLLGHVELMTEGEMLAVRFVRAPEEDDAPGS